jgi:hypothetical protein
MVVDVRLIVTDAPPLITLAVGEDDPADDMGLFASA